MTTTVTIRNFTGKAISLDVDPTTKVSILKDTITRTTLCKWANPALTWKGHELRNHQTLSHYDIDARDVLHILPPSKVPKMSLQFETPDGRYFTLEVNPDATVAQLKRDIAIEEKMDVQRLKFVSSVEDPDDPETVFVSEPQDLLEDALISQYPLSNSTIFTCGPPSTSSTFHVRVMLYDDGLKLDVKASLQQTLKDFRDAVLLQHHVSIADCVLMLVGKELVGDEIPIGDLGFVPDCTIHAVPFVSFDVEIIWKKKFDTMFLHPLTRLSEIRKMLEPEAPKDISLDEYWFTLDRKEHLKEWRRLWDLNIISGSTLYMRTGVISVVIKMGAFITKQVDVEEDETVWGLKERWSLITGAPFSDGERITYREKVLQDEKTLKEEGLAGGETLVWESIPFNSARPFHSQ